MVALQDLDHLQLAMPVGAEAAARAFYGGLLGLTEIDKPANLRGRGGAWYQLAGRQLHLGVQADFQPATKAHPAFLVDDLAGLRRILASHRHPILDDEPLPGFERFYSSDPFGNRLEFLRRV
jgi:catechol 2,3-dioxygenase-like lactoylglutathione lyase family enzyme